MKWKEGARGKQGGALTHKRIYAIQLIETFEKMRSELAIIHPHPTPFPQEREKPLPSPVNFTH